MLTHPHTSSLHTCDPGSVCARASNIGKASDGGGRLGRPTSVHSAATDSAFFQRRFHCDRPSQPRPPLRSHALILRRRPTGGRGRPERRKLRRTRALVARGSGSEIGAEAGSTFFKVRACLGGSFSRPFSLTAACADFDQCAPTPLSPHTPGIPGGLGGSTGFVSLLLHIC